MQAAEVLSRGGFTVAELERARDALLRAPVAEGGAGFTSAKSRIAGDHQTGGISWWSLPAGDLDGDGVGDLLTSSYDWTEERGTLIARRGSTAAALWVHDLSSGSYFQPVDLDGDGTSEVLLVGFEWGSQGFGALAVREVSWRLTVLEGSDGSTRWESVRSARMTAANNVPRVVRVVDFPFGIEVMGDASGDGSSDILVSLLSYTEMSAGSPPLVGAGTVEALVLEGADGGTVGSTLYRDIQGATAPTGVSDLSGDGLADVVGMRIGRDGQRLVAAHRGDGSSIWSAQVDRLRGHHEVREIFVVEGTAGPVVAFMEWNGSYASPAWTMDVWSAQGSPLWGRSMPGYPPVMWTPGDVDGDGFGDVGSAVWSYGDLGETLVVAMISMVSGSEIWSIARTVPAGHGDTSVWLEACPCTADLDGDGVTDPLIGRVAVGVSVTEIDTSGISGADGSVMWERFDSDQTGPPIVQFADLDGDGGADLGRFERPSRQSDRASLTFEAHDGATANPLWRNTWSGVPGQVNAWATGADLIAAPDAEVVVHLEWWDQRRAERFIVEYGVGPSGVIWQLGSL